MSIREILNLKKEIEALRAALLEKYGHLPWQVRVYKPRNIEEMFRVSCQWQETAVAVYKLRTAKVVCKKILKNYELLEEFYWGLYMICYRIKF